MLGFNDFKNKVSRTDEYRYDQNGNMNRDLNKDLNWVTFNSLNLPQKLQFVNGNKSEYLYDASGVKRQAKYSYSVAGVQMPINDSYTENSSISSTATTYYCGNYIYEQTGTNAPVLKRILTPEGYIAADNGNRYSYFLKDHLGDTRVNISAPIGSTSCSVDQTTHYYPFGLEFYSHLGDILSGSNPYLYNGKEMDRVNGLNMLDYGARWYDATVGRWGVVDPLAEKSRRWSPYNYCYDDPIKFTDPDGMYPSELSARSGGWLPNEPRWDPWFHEHKKSDIYFYLKHPTREDNLIRGREPRLDKGGNSKDGNSRGGHVLDPAKLSYTNTRGKVQLHNNNPYTKKMSINQPIQVAVAMKQIYKSQYGKDLDIRTESLALEIYVHAILSKFGILSSHTDDADCGDNKISSDSNRFLWDTWTANPIQRLR